MASGFILTTCQPGFEPALKAEVSARFAEYRFAYSRPGFVTFKVVEVPAAGFDLGSVFARAYAVSLGKAGAATSASPAAAFEERVNTISTRLREFRAKRLHVWSRDEALLEPGFVERVHDAIVARSGVTADSNAQEGELVLDVVLVATDEWWIGYHEHHAEFHRPWPGGIFPGALPAEAPSRAYLKAAEALEWPGMPVREGDVVLELGSSPGGISLACLERGLKIIGVDPADMDPLVALNSNFRHVRKQAQQLRPVDLGEPVQWIISDMNLSPQEVLTAVRRAAGLTPDTLLGAGITVKLTDLKFANDVAQFLEQTRRMGFEKMRAVQLHSNRNEIWISAFTARGLKRLASAKGQVAATVAKVR